MEDKPLIRLKVLACDVLNREISFISSQSNCFIDVSFIHQGLHSTPDKLRAFLKQEIDKANEGFPYNFHSEASDYDFIILAYGLCSNGITGLTSGRIPLVVPRAHDCITLLLGSKEHYKEYFDSNPGTYWFSSGWIERSFQPSEKKYEVLYKEYLEKYGEDNAQYLLETEQGWMKDYKNAAFIYWDCIANMQSYREFTIKSAEYFGWSYTEYEGKIKLLERLLNADFDDKEVLVVPPGKQIVQSYDESIIRYE
jgi:hypothetical protein